MPVPPPPPPFPVVGIMPREETTSAAFTAATAHHDGRGVTIGILDTGVDFMCAGLRATTTGERKLVDVLDCTGSGDVCLEATAATEGADGKHTLTSPLTGAAIRVDPAGLNMAAGSISETGEATFRVGVKRAYEIFPKKLERSVAKTRREVYERAHNKHLSVAKSALAGWKAAGKEATKEELEGKKDLEARVAHLEKAMKGYSDPGPILDILSFTDAEGRHCALVPTAATPPGDYTALEPM